MGSEWERCVLGSVARLQGGYAFKSKDFASSGIPVVKIKNVRKQTIAFSDVDYVSEAVAEKADNFYVRHGDVLISMTGSGPNAPASVVGRVARHTGNDHDFLINQRVGRFIVRDIEKLSLRYLYYFLGQAKVQDFLVSIATGSANQVNISGKQIEAIEMPLPPIEAQRCISAILGSLEDKIELNHQMNTTLEAMAQALFKSWFVDFDPVIDNALAAGIPIPDEPAERAERRKQLHARTAASASGHLTPGQPLPVDIQQQFPDRFVFTEEMGWVPEGWEVLSLSEAIQINPKVSLKKGQVAKYVDMKALPTSGYSIAEYVEKSYAGGAKFLNDDLLLARITPCLENGKTGLVDFLEEGEPGFGSTEFIVLRAKGDLRSAFIASLARDHSFRQHCITSMVGSSGRQRVQNACFDNYFICVPRDASILRIFDELCAPNFKKMTSLKNEINSLSSLRDTLLTKLLSGQLRIPEAEQQLAEVI